MNRFFDDLKEGFGILRKNPGLVAGGLLALTIGVSTAVLVSSGQPVAPATFLCQGAGTQTNAPPHSDWPEWKMPDWEGWTAQGSGHSRQPRKREGDAPVSRWMREWTDRLCDSALSALSRKFGA